MGTPQDRDQDPVTSLQSLDDLRALMPVIGSGLYLDHAAVGMLSQPVADAIIQRIHSATTHGVKHWNVWRKLIQRTRKLAAELIGGHEDEIAFVPNTATGIGMIAEGFRWRPGDNVVLSSKEFPSNRFPWLNLQRRGVEVRQIDAPDNPDAFAEAFDAACDSNTQIVTCSWVDYSTGVRRDPARLAEVAHRHDALLVLDAIQGLGVLPLDLHAQNIDVLVADSRKWLMGPEGAGILAIRKEQQDRIEVTRPGWASTADPLNFGAPELQLSDTATRFESGMHNTFGLAGLHASLRLLKDISATTREEHLLAIRSVFEEAGRSAGLLSKTWPQSAQSGILTFNHPKLEPADLIRHLRTLNITVSLKQNCIRVSPHLYNNADDASHFAQALAELHC